MSVFCFKLNTILRIAAQRVALSNGMYSGLLLYMAKVISSFVYVVKSLSTPKREILLLKQTDRQIISIYQRSITEGQKLLKYEDWNSLSSTQKVSRSPQFSRRYLNIFACGGQMKQTNCAFYSSFSSSARKDSEVKFESIRQQIGTQIDNTTRKGQMGFIGGCESKL